MTHRAFVALVALGAMTAEAQSSDVAIVGFRPETRTLTSGGVATSAVDVENRGRVARHVWIGYSVGAPDGAWYDVPPVQIDLAAGARGTRQLSWTVPTDAPPAAGHYRVVMAVWSASPGSEGATRLASADRRDAFRIDLSTAELRPEVRSAEGRSNKALSTAELRPEVRSAEGRSNKYHAGDHRLGRGRVLPSAVQWSSDGFRLRLAADSCNGAEVRTVDRYRFGEFTARMRTPVAPGSLSAFFLYADQPDGNDEIDIELHNDGSRRAILTAWIAGKETRSAELTLAFDPAAAEHEYTIRWTHSELSFFADGRRLGGWTSRFPQSPMRLMANVWWPTWLECRPLAAPVELTIPTIRIDSTGIVR